MNTPSNDDEKKPVELIVENKLSWIDAGFSYRATGLDDPAFAWSSDKDDHPPLSARDAMRLAGETMDELWEDARRQGTDYGIMFEDISLKIVSKDAWAWIARYKFYAFNHIPIQGVLPEIEIPILMNGRVPVPHKKEFDAPLKAPLPIAPIAINEAPSRSMRLIHMNEPTEEQIRRGNIFGWYSGHYGQYRFTIEVNYTDLPNDLLWDNSENNPPLAPRRAMKIANDHMQKVRRKVAAPATDIRFHQLRLIPLRSRWYWLGEYQIDNNDEEDLFNLLEVPIPFDGCVPAIEYEKVD